MSSIRCFRDLEVWNVSMDLVLSCYALTDRYPQQERYGLTRETRRSAISIPANVAEGHNRHQRKVYRNHISIALGSQGELETQLEVARRLGYVTAQELRDTLDLLERVGQMLNGLRRSLKRRSMTNATLAALGCFAAAWLLR